jgi:hypothetical protein
MQGEYHMEVLYRPDGEVRLYLTDAFRAAIAQSRGRGRVIVRPAGGQAATVPLRAGCGGSCLSARGPTPAAGENMVTVDITLDGTPWRIEVPFQR